MPRASPSASPSGRPAPRRPTPPKRFLAGNRIGRTVRQRSPGTTRQASSTTSESRHASSPRHPPRQVPMHPLRHRPAAYALAVGEPVCEDCHPFVFAPPVEAYLPSLRGPVPPPPRPPHPLGCSSPRHPETDLYKWGRNAVVRHPAGVVGGGKTTAAVALFRPGRGQATVARRRTLCPGCPDVPRDPARAAAGHLPPNGRRPGPRPDDLGRYDRVWEICADVLTGRHERGLPTIVTTNLRVKNRRRRSRTSPTSTQPSIDAWRRASSWASPRPGAENNDPEQMNAQIVRSAHQTFFDWSCTTGPSRRAWNSLWNEILFRPFKFFASEHARVPRACPARSGQTVRPTLALPALSRKRWP